MAEKHSTNTTERVWLDGGWIEPMEAGLWRIQGKYMYGGTIDDIPTRKLALEILEALAQTAEAVQDLSFDSGRC